MWHREVITEAIEQTLWDLRRVSVLRNFYLAEGTGLALHVGHRRSIDLDFFSRESFDPEAILGKVEPLNELRVLAKDLKSQTTLHERSTATLISAEKMQTRRSEWALSAGMDIGESFLAVFSKCAMSNGCHTQSPGCV